MKKDITYVVIQFFLFALYLIGWNFFSIETHFILGYISLGITFFGGIIIILGIIHLNDNLTPLPTPKEDSVLISSGIYKYIRHPIYTGILITLFSYAIYSGSISRIIISIVLFAVFYFKSEYEEKMLMQRYDQYKLYRVKTGRFFPKHIK